MKDPDRQAVCASHAEVQAKVAEIAALRAELDETNRGVLALHAELDIRAEDLLHATELKSRFLTYMSHEFRTPIGAIRSIARLLMDRVDGPLTAEQETQVRFIQDTAAEFSEMVDDLLDLAKVEAGQLEICPEWFEMVDLFSALRGMFKPMLTNHDVALVFEEPHEVPSLFNDDRKLAQILRNFISNALKFTQKGEIRLSARRNDDDTVTFAVADTGIGIAPEFHHAIFQDFVQVDSPIQKRLRGTGLGLSLSKRLAELLGGTVALQSELGNGAVFSIRLPLRLPNQSAGTRGAEQS
ncbi:histidine kinase [Chitinimonas arctica]|uniref:histidine kinase n=1 Tax=Chitinimonas arctica TaxID=2594795 RepID=A0A516SBQ0_9NEIS|nr:ATP-binding protein [Chitinimonas arctica]QDQ25576.1 histidine kinase [Chitinimonas arctica]